MRLTALTYDAPTITLNTDRLSLELSWPALPSGFVLESSPNLSPEATWTLEASASLIITNGFNKATVQTGLESRFYRVTRR